MSQDNRNKKSDVFYITHSGELLIWLIIVLITIAFLSVLNIKKHTELSKKSFDIFMPDADGLIVGSPVRMMGIEVGHVVKIKPTSDEVYIRFLITNDNVTIPQGTEATVEFSGMAGSKSLELYVPDNNTYIDQNTPILSVNPPKRLHDAIGLLNDMFKRIGNMIITTTNFTNELKNIDMPVPVGKAGEAEEFLKYANDVIDESNERINNLGRKIESYGKK